MSTMTINFFKHDTGVVLRYEGVKTFTHCSSGDLMLFIGENKQVWVRAEDYDYYGAVCLPERS